MSLIDALPTINALLNATAATLLFLGFWAIKQKKISLHRQAMQGAFLTSAVFLASYLTRAYLTGTHRFPGEGLLKLAYLAILFSHMILAVVMLPFIFRTLFLARKSRYVEHRRVARWTLPMWIYTSVTGVLVYLMLYHLV